jgi:DNA-binding IclR family transcriptional regulator
MARQPNDVARTLEHGLEVLDLLADHPDGLTIAEMSANLRLDRTVIHRLVRTLASHRLVKGNENKRYQLSLGLIRLAETISQDLRSVAFPVLEELADTVRATANVAVPDDGDAIVLATVEPRRAQVHVAYRAGLRHSLNAGAAGLAILAGRSARPDERTEVSTARAVGYAISHEEVIGNTWGVSAPIDVRDRRIEASVGVSLFRSEDIEQVGELVRAAARQVSDALW